MMFSAVEQRVERQTLDGVRGRRIRRTLVAGATSSVARGDMRAEHREREDRARCSAPVRQRPNGENPIPSAPGPVGT
jgi:hypothetical protein